MSVTKRCFLPCQYRVTYINYPFRACNICLQQNLCLWFEPCMDGDMRHDANLNNITGYLPTSFELNPLVTFDFEMYVPQHLVICTTKCKHTELNVLILTLPVAQLITLQVFVGFSISLNYCFCNSSQIVIIYMYESIMSLSKSLIVILSYVI